MESANVNEKSPDYGMSRKVEMSYEDAIVRITELLKEQGFGILTEIDVKKTLKTKIDKDFTKYIILGACNPNLAFRALSSEIEIGLLLPCNVTVHEDPADGKTVVTMMDPAVMMKITDNPEVAQVAKEARPLLEAALNAL